MKHFRSLAHRAAVVATFAAGATCACGAELYRWIDERGIVNYSNEPPPKGRAVKDLRTVEDRLSIYTPEKRIEVTPTPPTPAPAPGYGREPSGRALPPPPASALPPKPCANPDDPNCYAGVPYESSPVFIGRQRPPQVIQPQLPPGTTAGNVTGSSGYIAGQSGSAPPAAPPGARPRQPSGSFTLKEDRELRR